MSEKNEIALRYKFSFEDGREFRFRIRLDATTLEITAPLDNPPIWAKLDFQRCGCCPLDSAQHPYCPAAARLHPIVEQMGKVVSSERVRVTVSTAQRTIARDCAAQDGLSSLIGVTSACSGCPITAFFRPMARFHLPFADLDETTYRAVSCYMLAQYFRVQRGQKADLSLDGLRALYERVSDVNKRLANRLRSDQDEDGVVNAIVILDMFAQGLPAQFDDLLEGLEPAFQPFFLEQGAPAPANP